MHYVIDSRYMSHVSFNDVTTLIIFHAGLSVRAVYGVGLLPLDR